jgi:hypothetical protein
MLELPDGPSIAADALRVDQRSEVGSEDPRSGGRACGGEPRQDRDLPSGCPPPSSVSGILSGIPKKLLVAVGLWARWASAHLACLVPRCAVVQGAAGNHHLQRTRSAPRARGCPRLRPRPQAPRACTALAFDSRAPRHDRRRGGRFAAVSRWRRQLQSQKHSTVDCAGKNPRSNRAERLAARSARDLIIREHRRRTSHRDVVGAYAGSSGRCETR